MGTWQPGEVCVRVYEYMVMWRLEHKEDVQIMTGYSRVGWIGLECVVVQWRGFERKKVCLKCNAMQRRRQEHDPI